MDYFFFFQAPHLFGLEGLSGKDLRARLAFMLTAVQAAVIVLTQAHVCVSSLKCIRNSSGADDFAFQ